MPFADKFKRTVRDNFDKSVLKYEELEATTGHFAGLTDNLIDFVEGQATIPQMSGKSSPGDTMFILDVGTGTGAAIGVLHRRFPEARLFGIDISERMLDIAKKNYPFADFTCGDAELLENYYDKGTFDLIVYPASLFLLPNQEASIAGAKRLLRPGGVLAASLLSGLSEKHGRTVKSLKGSKGIITNENLPEIFSKHFGSVECVGFDMDMSIERTFAFYRIEAQSAGLFPGKPYDERMNLINDLISEVRTEGYSLVQSWDFISAMSPNQ